MGAPGGNRPNPLFRMEDSGADSSVSVVVVKRPPRAVPPEVPAGRIPLEAPPRLPSDREPRDHGTLTTLLPLLGLAVSSIFLLLPGSAAFTKVVGAMTLTLTAVLAAERAVRSHRGAGGRLDRARRDYFAYLAGLREQVRATARAQRAAQSRLHPDPGQLWSVAADRGRLWERRPGDGDFARIRLGLGPQALATALIAPVTGPLDALDPLTADAMRRFLAAHGTVAGVPMSVSLRDHSYVTICGEPRIVRAAARAAVAQLAVLHSPADLVIAVAAGPGAAERWDWTKWLPHAQQHSGRVDGAGSGRLFGGSVSELAVLLAGRLDGRPPFRGGTPPLPDRPHVVIVLDGTAVPAGSALGPAGGLLGVTVIEVVPGEPGAPCGGLSVVVRPGSLAFGTPGGRLHQGWPDALSLVEAEALARQLAPLRVADGDDADPDFTHLLGLGDADPAEVARAWRPRAAHERLRVPIGAGENGEPVVLDLKDAARGGMGPHGLCVGATGSGLSELLRTLVLGLAVTHSSESLNFVLADVRGTGTFAGLSALPHVAAHLTGPDDRLHVALTGELRRRRELLRAAGDFAGVEEYERVRAGGAALEPLPSVVVVVDGLGELLTARPQLTDTLLAIGHAGGPLGVHLLLASRRPPEGAAHGLDPLLSYRVALRTSSPADSLATIGAPDACHLPPVPGSGYLRSGTSTPARFRAPRVSDGYRDGVTPPPGRCPALFTAAPVPMPYPAKPDPEPSRPSAGGSLLDAIVRQLADRGRRARQV